MISKDMSQDIERVLISEEELAKIVMALEEEFDMEIPDADAEKVVTVGDVVEYIKENV